MGYNVRRDRELGGRHAGVCGIKLFGCGVGRDRKIPNETPLFGIDALTTGSHSTVRRSSNVLIIVRIYAIPIFVSNDLNSVVSIDDMD